MQDFPPELNQSKYNPGAEEQAETKKEEEAEQNKEEKK